MLTHDLVGIGLLILILIGLVIYLVYKYGRS